MLCDTRCLCERHQEPEHPAPWGRSETGCVPHTASAGLWSWRHSTQQQRTQARRTSAQLHPPCKTSPDPVAEYVFLPPPPPIVKRYCTSCRVKVIVPPFLLKMQNESCYSGIVGNFPPPIKEVMIQWQSNCDPYHPSPPPKKINKYSPKTKKKTQKNNQVSHSGTVSVNW